MQLDKGLYVVVLGISLWCSLASVQITRAFGFSGNPLMALPLAPLTGKS
jgi:hypothetical protein